MAYTLYFIQVKVLINDYFHRTITLFNTFAMIIDDEEEFCCKNT